MGARAARAALFVALGAACLFAVARAGGTSEHPAPRVRLERASVRGDKVVAPTTHGRALAELTLDPTLQAAAKRLIVQARPEEGAIVVVDVRTGALLAWAERRDRAVRDVAGAARAPAASVFKLVTTAALFEHGRATPKDVVCTLGGDRGVEREHLDPPRDPRARCGTLFQALGHSRNAVFAQLATRHLLRTDLLATAESLGFNGPVPFDWPVPLGQLSVPYNDLEFARAATGFRGSTLSPLGGAFLATIVARGGQKIRLHVVRRAPGYEAPETFAPLGRVLGETTARRLSRMMEVTVQSGTASRSFSDARGRSLLPGVRVAGKTGTLRAAGRDTTTSWFVGFAPSRRPEVALSVLLQNGRVWHRRAAEVARDVLRAYFHARGRPSIRDPFEAVVLKE
ncbi:MAG TPA: penicillin-binding transpeptidase domain-containing protein [Polyangiaceae bacterium]|nr:penicillin-binding transpeptidase domain-containing protein [Polyangiaceae bacterium]